MPRWQRVYLTSCAAVIAYALAYVAVDYAKVPRPFYRPLERRWVLASRLPGLPMGYVGLWLYALAAAVLVAGVVWIVAGRRKTELAARTLGLGAAWAGTAMVLGLGYFAWNNWP